MNANANLSSPRFRNPATWWRMVPWLHVACGPTVHGSVSPATRGRLGGTRLRLAPVKGQRDQLARVEQPAGRRHTSSAHITGAISVAACLPLEALLSVSDALR